MSGLRLRLLVSEAWRSLGANLSTTFAAMMTVLIGMFLLGLLIALGTWTVSWSNHVKRELVAQIDFKVSSDKGGPATKAQENAVARALNENPLVEERGRSSRRQRALKRMRKERAAARQAPAVQPVPGHHRRDADKGEDLEKRSTEPADPLPPGVTKVDQRQADVEPDPPLRALGRGDLPDRGRRSCSSRRRS